jgi:regulator of protease activity HflC (stomatin/prohibitin superfamily)
MKKIKLLFVIGMVAILGACSKVPAGNVGVKVYLLGTDKGVDTEELGVGRYYIGVNEELYLFPTFTQNYVWTADEAEGSPNDESITFQTTEGLNVNADVGISYHINPKKVSTVFQKYRKGVEEITDIYLRNMVRDAFVAESSVMPVESVYGKGKSDLIASVEKRVKAQTGDLGIVVERIYFVGSLRLPDTVVAALNAKIEATQKAQQRQNEIAQAKAEADKKIEEARGTAESKLAVAKAEAEAIKLKGKALRMNPEVLQLNAIDKWDGVLPRFTGENAVPFIDVTKK